MDVNDTPTSFPPRSAVNPRVPVVVVGSIDSPEFTDLMDWMRQHRSIHVVATWRRLVDVLSAAALQGQYSRFVIVLQSWSDQFDKAEADQLLAQSWNGTLLCCQGSWCESDGRTRSIWPVSVTVPVRFARSVIDFEITRFCGQIPSPPPTAGAEEIFSDRCSARSARDSSSQRVSVGHEHVLIVSDDRAWRDTVSEMLHKEGMHCSTRRRLTNQDVA
ncbi:MAG: hypothetical protein KDA96_14780, partial [Planctomycetaceae bacterium]|nr:hypothetical protein [Planctomycetaceae bacterium]